MRTVYILCVATATVLFLSAINSRCQAQIIVTDTTVFVEEFVGFEGSGLNPSGASGALDSKIWRVFGMSDGDSDYDGTAVSGDFARGTTAGGVSSGGVYAFVSPSVTGVLIQPTGSDASPGGVQARIVNELPVSIRTLTLHINWKYFNNNGRASSLSTYVTNNGDTIFALPATWQTAESADATGVRDLVDTLVVVTAPIAPLDTVECMFVIDDVSGSGGRDELILTRFAVQANLPEPIVDVDSLYTIGEDTAAHLNIAVSDADTPLEELLFHCESTATVGVDASISGDSLSLYCDPAPNWNGKDTLTLIVSDGYNTVESHIVVHVEAVNDPPVLTVPDTLHFNRHDTLRLPLRIEDIDNDVDLDSEQTLHVGSTNSVIRAFKYCAQNSTATFLLDCAAPIPESIEVWGSDGIDTVVAYVQLYKREDVGPYILAPECDLSSILVYPHATIATNTLVLGAGAVQCSDVKFSLHALTPSDTSVSVLSLFPDNCRDTTTLTWHPKGGIATDDEVLVHSTAGTIRIPVLINDIGFDVPDSISAYSVVNEVSVDNHVVQITFATTMDTSASCTYTVYQGSCSSTASIRVSRVIQTETTASVTSAGQVPHKFVQSTFTVSGRQYLSGRRGIREVATSNQNTNPQRYVKKWSSESITSVFLDSTLVVLHANLQLCHYRLQKSTSSSVSLRLINTLKLPFQPDYIDGASFSESGNVLRVFVESDDRLELYAVASGEEGIFVQYLGGIPLPRISQQDRHISCVSSNGMLCFTTSYLSTEIRAYQRTGQTVWSLLGVVTTTENGHQCLSYSVRGQALAVLNRRSGSVCVYTFQDPTRPQESCRFTVCAESPFVTWLGPRSLASGCIEHNDQHREVKAGFEHISIPVSAYTKKVSTDSWTADTSTITTYGYQRIQRWQVLP